MICFLFSILCSTALALVFKFSERFRVSLLRLIFINYLTCALIGCLLTNKEQFNSLESVFEPAVMAVIIGCFFIIAFYLLGSTTRHAGVTIAVIAQKLSMVIPVIFGFIYFEDSIHFHKISGIVLAVPAVYLSTYKPHVGSLQRAQKYVWLPVLLFLASGACDVTVKLAQHQFLSDIDFNFFLFILFVTSTVLSLLAVSVGWVRSGFELSKHELWLGGLLGLANYGSIFYFIKTLNLPGLESSFVFPVNNVSIVALTALLAWLLFKENLSKRNLAGLGIATLAIALISLQNA